MIEPQVRTTEPAGIVAEHAATFRGAVPPKVVAGTKEVIVDTLGALIAGTSASAVLSLGAQLRAWGGRAESTAILLDLRLPAPQAALLNSFAGQIHELDSVYEPASMHGYSLVVPAVLAVAEAERISGAEALTAIVVGNDLAIRAGLSIRRRHTGWYLTPIGGIFGVTTAVGRLLRLTPDQMWHALGLAYSSIGGNRQAHADGANAKALEGAAAAQAGITAAYYARAGLTGPREVFGGCYGLLEMFGGDGGDADALTAELGERFEGTSLSLKPYACCRLAHGAVDAAVACARELGPDPSEIEGVVVRMPDLRMLDLLAQPFAVRSNPTVDAQFSIPYCVALALSGRPLFLDDFEPDAVRRPDRLDLVRRVTVQLDSALGGTYATPVEVTVHLRDGRSATRRVEQMLGDPALPLDAAQRREKLERCVGFARRPLSPERVDRLVADVRRLELLPDVGAIVEL